MSECEHPTLRTGDTFDQIQRVTPCMFCERDQLREQVSHLEKCLQTVTESRDRLHAALARIAKERTPSSYTAQQALSGT